MRRDDDDDLSGDGRRSAGDPSWFDAVVVPDDISALDAEVRALRRERRAAARRRRLGPVRRAAAPLIVIAMVLAAGIAGLVLVLPRRPGLLPAAPLASADSGVGRVRGLVPDVRVGLADGSTRPVRDYRPAVLALVPTGCACEAALRESSLSAARHQVQFVLVDPTTPTAVTGRGDRGVILRVTDTSGTLARTYGATGDRAHSAGSPVLVLVAGDGRVSRVLTEAADRRTLDSELALLSLQVAPTP